MKGWHIRNLLSDDDGDWLRYTDNVLNRLDINREVARYLDEKQWRGLLTNRTQAAEEKRWRDAMGRKSKLRTYRTVKDKLVFEPYQLRQQAHSHLADAPAERDEFPEDREGKIRERSCGR